MTDEGKSCESTASEFDDEAIARALQKEFDQQYQQELGKLRFF